MNTKFLIIFKYITIFIIILLTLYKFRFKVPTSIFENTTVNMFLSYIIIFIINIIIFIIILLFLIDFKYVQKKKSFIGFFSTKINSWVESSYEKIMTDIANIQGTFSILLAYITHYFVKIHITILQIIAFGPRIILLIALSYDILYLNILIMPFIYYY